MKCEQVELLLSDYMEGELSMEMNGYVEEHLNDCPRCREEYDSLKETAGEIRRFSENLVLSCSHKEKLRNSLVREQRIYTASSPFLSALHRKKEELKRRFFGEESEAVNGD